jgi:hypothetical protein
VVQAEAQAQEAQLGQLVQGLEVQAEELQEHPHQVHHHHHPGKAQGQVVRLQGSQAEGELQELRPWEGREMSSHPRSHHEI